MERLIKSSLFCEKGGRLGFEIERDRTGET